MQHQDVSDIKTSQTSSTGKLYHLAGSEGLFPLQIPRQANNATDIWHGLPPREPLPVRQRFVGNPPGRPHWPDAGCRRVTTGPMQVAGA